jgi:hypothetical protein
MLSMLWRSIDHLLANFWKTENKIIIHKTQSQLPLHCRPNYVIVNQSRDKITDKDKDKDRQRYYFSQISWRIMIV